MRPGPWYKLLSYFLELPVEKRQSRYSGELTLTFHNGKYKLSTANAIYSFGKAYTSYAIPFRTLGMMDLPLQKVLVLGFGLGSVVDLLGGHPHIRQITAVDADEVVLELAGKYLFTSRDKVQFVCADALAYVRECDQRYDLIISDIFIDDKTPVPFLQEDYLVSLKKILAPEGWLLFSKLDLSKADQVENKQFENGFREVFPEAFTIQAEGNRIFCSRG